MIYTLKGATPLLEEDALPVGNHRRICIKLSIISFLYHVRDSSRNILNGYPAPLSLFFSSMGDRRVWQGRSCKGSIGSSPNCLYPDLVGDMHKEKNEEKNALTPMIWIYERNEMKKISITLKQIYREQ
jgi:hypothetical protein